MTARTATCSCGALQARCSGAPARNSVCHCLDCKRRSGSAFAWGATFKRDQVEISGESRSYTRIGDEGRWGRFHFCPACGVTVFYEIEARPAMITVPAGGFADPDFPAPDVSVYGERRERWLTVGGEEAPVEA